MEHVLKLFSIGFNRIAILGCSSCSVIFYYFEVIMYNDTTKYCYSEPYTLLIEQKQSLFKTRLVLKHMHVFT